MCFLSPSPFATFPCVLAAVAWNCLPSPSGLGGSAVALPYLTILNPPPRSLGLLLLTTPPLASGKLDFFPPPPPEITSFSVGKVLGRTPHFSEVVAQHCCPQRPPNFTHCLLVTHWRYPSSVPPFLVSPVSILPLPNAWNAFHLSLFTSIVPSAAPKRQSSFSS